MHADTRQKLQSYKIAIFFWTYDEYDTEQNEDGDDGNPTDSA